MLPKLFNAVLESTFRKLNWGGLGIKIGHINLTDLKFADDVTLVSKKKEELLLMISKLKTKAEESGLKINKSKTKIISNTDDNEYKVDNWKIEKV